MSNKKIKLSLTSKQISAITNALHEYAGICLDECTKELDGVVDGYPVYAHDKKSSGYRVGKYLEKLNESIHKQLEKAGERQ
jgi:hypothetical protein